MSEIIETFDREAQETAKRATGGGRAPLGWRVWIIAVAAVILNETAPLVVAGAMVAGVLVIFHSLHRQAGMFADAESQPLRRRLTQLATDLAALSAYLFAAFYYGGTLLGDSPWRVPILILSAAGIGGWMVYGMIRLWWRPLYMFTVGSALPVIGILAVWFAPASLAGEAPAQLWGANFVRLTSVVLLVGLCGLGERGKKFGLSDLSLLAETGLFAGLLGLVFRQPGALVGAQGPQMAVWMTLTCVVVLMASVVIVRMRPAWTHDMRWVKQWYSGDSKRGLVGLGLYGALLAPPALVLTSIASWPVWLTVYAVIAGAIAIRAANRGADALLSASRAKSNKAPAAPAAQTTV